MSQGRGAVGYSTAYFGQVKDDLPSGFGVNFSEWQRGGAYKWIELGWFEEGWLVRGQRVEGGKAVEEGFFDKENNGALSRGVEANSLLNAGCYDKNVKKD